MGTNIFDILALEFVLFSNRLCHGRGCDRLKRTMTYNTFCVRELQSIMSVNNFIRPSMMGRIMVYYKVILIG